MHNLTRIAAAEEKLADVLHAEVDDLDPCCDCLHEILAAAHARSRSPLWPWVLLAAIGALLIIAGVAMAAATEQPERARIPAHVTYLMEP